MKKRTIISFVSLLCMLSLLTACTALKDNTNPKADPLTDEIASHLGTIVQKEDNGQRWLISQYEEENDPPSVSAIWFSVTADTLLESSDGTALSSSELQIGQQVEAWSTGGIAESYPMQAKAVKIIVITEAQDQPSAQINKQKAIQLAIDALEPNFFAAVKHVTLNEDRSLWTVELVDGSDLESINTITINAENGAIQQQPVAENDAFRVFAPAPEMEVGSTFTVNGEARVFEAAFRWTLEDGHNILAEGYTMADQGAPEWGQFEFEVSYEGATNPTLLLILYVSSMKDGSTEHELIIPLKHIES